ncbi:MAG: FAD-dependent thymidylate synthase [Acidimicrobiia bacterium]|nr:FAD-dependent thymidylate synthase [Acidimicrobiia bacterium]MDX2468400.1 FAD-dependent thymidylate synthase [Acidimicrobiia bacterium]
MTFHIEEFTDQERRVLARFFTNLDSPVFAIVNLPEVVKGALFARYSRSPKSVRRLFLDEFYNQPELGVEHVAAELDGDDPVVKLQKAQDLYDRVFSEYGDDSVAQLGGAHLACEQASNILTKVLEWGRLASYLEQSTRYIFYDKKLGDGYRYMIPSEIESSRHRDRYVETMDWLFDTYADLIGKLVPYYETLYPKQDGDSNFVWRSTIRAKACDDIRGLLPAATTSNVGIFGSGQAYEMLLIRMRSHPLAEAREFADLMLTELRKVVPSFMRRVDIPGRGVDWSEYLESIAARMNQHAHALSADPEPQPEVRLVDWDPDGELKTAAAALYSYTSLGDDQLTALVADMSEDERSDLIRSYIGDRRNRRHKPGRAMERTDYRFDILCDYGIFRDLQRHRMLTIEWQRLSPSHGYITPESIADVGATDVWDEAMARTADLFNEIAADLGPDVAQYAIPFAYRIRFFFQLNAREAFHLLELRTGAGGHPGYRRVCQEMHRLIGDQAGHHLIADAMKNVDHQDHDLARLEGERRAAAKRAAAGIADPG